jgi:hypothetical protein
MGRERVGRAPDWRSTSKVGSPTGSAVSGCCWHFEKHVLGVRVRESVPVSVTVADELERVIHDAES